MRRLFYIMMAFVPFLFCGCEDDSIPDGDSGAAEVSKLVSKVENCNIDDDSEVYSFYYDSMGRLTEMKYNGETECLYTYSDGVLSLKENEEDAEADFLYFNDNVATRIVYSWGGKVFFVYDENCRLSSQYRENPISHYENTYEYIWDEGNIVEVSDDNGKEVRIYYDREDKFNIDVLSILEFGIVDDCAVLDKSVFKGIFCRNLLKRIEGRSAKYPILSLSYEFDSDGYPVKVSVVETGDSWSIEYYK